MGSVNRTTSGRIINTYKFDTIGAFGKMVFAYMTEKDRKSIIAICKNEKDAKLCEEVIWNNISKDVKCLDIQKEMELYGVPMEICNGSAGANGRE